MRETLFNLIAVNSNGLQPNSTGLQPSSDGLQPKRDDLQPKSDGLQLRAMASNLVAAIACKLPGVFRDFPWIDL